MTASLVFLDVALRLLNLSITVHTHMGGKCNLLVNGNTVQLASKVTSNESRMKMTLVSILSQSWHIISTEVCLLRTRPSSGGIRFAGHPRGGSALAGYINVYLRINLLI